MAWLSRFLQSPTDTVQIASVGSQATSVLDYGAVGDGVTNDAQAIRDAVAATPAGGTLVFPTGRTYYVAAGWRIYIRKSMTITGGKIVSGDGMCFVVSSSDVAFDAVEIQGPGPAYPYNGYSKAVILAAGSYDAPLHNISIRRCHLYDLANSGVWVQWVVNCSITHNYIHNFRYGGIMALSISDSLIQANNVQDAVMISPVVNVYGIAVTDASNTDVGRSRRVIIDSNHVRNVVEWEGIDTHGGEQLTISNNVVSRCRTGIGLVVGNSSRSLAPKDIVCVGNIVDGEDIPVKSRGIGLIGIRDGEKASGVFTGNRILNYPQPWTIYEPDYANLQIQSNLPDYLPWRPLDMGPGWSSHAAYPAEFMVQGDKVHLRGLAMLGSGASVSNVATLPPEARPSSNRFGGYNTSSNGGLQYQVFVATDGTIHFLYRKGRIDAVAYVLSAEVHKS